MNTGQMDPLKSRERCLMEEHYMKSLAFCKREKTIGRGGIKQKKMLHHVKILVEEEKLDEEFC